jgi:hypothetical protein
MHPMKRMTQAGLAGLCGVVLMFGAGVGAPGAWAQEMSGTTIQIAPPQVNQQRVLATVTGKVMCSDTQRAARFATVTLIGTQEVQEGGQRGGFAGGEGNFAFGRRVQARTDIDGNFTVQAEPGDYYVVASAVGYASQAAEIAAGMSSGATPADLLARLPQVHVAEAGGGSVNITLDRGGVVQGKVQWDDGSPAAGVNMSVQTTGSGTSTSIDMVRTVSQLGGAFGGGFGGFQTTDDRGVFRITGLPPGSYWVRAVIMTPSAEPGAGTFQRMASVILYAPGKVRRSDAQVVTLKSGEERDDVQLTVDMSALHTVSGHVGATDEGSIAAGVVRLTDSQDSSLTRMAMVQPDGSFVVQWVPAGTYTLAVTNASDIPRQMLGGRRGQQQSAGTSYAPFQESLTVADTDVSGVGVTLSPATTASSQ